MSATHAERARRIGVHAGHDTYKWWALSCTCLGHAARHDQLGHADHRAARPRAQPPHQPARAGVGDPRLHDRLDRARAERRPAVRPVRAKEGLHRRLRAVRAGVAGRRLRRQRHRAHPVADRSRASAARSCSPTRRRSSPTPSRASSSGWPWAPTRWSRRSAWSSARCSAARWWRSRGTGCSGSTCRSPSPGAPGRGYPPRGHRPLRGHELRRARDDHVPDRPDRPRLRHLQGRASPAGTTRR